MLDELTIPGAIVAIAALASAVLIIVLRSLLKRYALARPNARSSHQAPTPQGGGIAVVTATIAVSLGMLFQASGETGTVPLAILFAAVILIAIVGVIADIHPYYVVPRFLLQALAVAAVIFALPEELRVMPFLPWWIERVLLVLGGLWFVNLVNFMDGLDWMTVAEVVPVTATLAAIGLIGILPPILPPWAVTVSLSLCGAMIGFAYFNRPVARLFLGDVGSLPIGLMLGWLLVLVAGNGGRAAAILLPLYYLADSTITLLRRIANGEKIWQAHRSHFYQRATDHGFTVIQIVRRVFLVNLVLAALALATVLRPSRELDIAALIAGVMLVAWLLMGFVRGPRIGRRSQNKS
ncbi:MAG TPA: glycosyltransferase family 4 protein [Xanthobacteraceae bacterium]|jgi:UDP-N-acetylmuramyl pentapeptide phosphotransferase/UDP-N-acetylglucosamine-1-phosphate transferase|nr:glycosyltransferase family 4 protein [Xanthobacteraceae bacterium]